MFHYELFPSICSIVVLPCDARPIASCGIARPIVIRNENTFFLGNRLYKSSAVAEMGDRLATIDMGRKLQGCSVPLWGGGSCSGSPSNTMWPGPAWAEAYLNAKWRLEA